MTLAVERNQNTNFDFMRNYWSEYLLLNGNQLLADVHFPPPPFKLTVTLEDQYSLFFKVTTAFTQQ